MLAAQALSQEQLDPSSKDAKQHIAIAVKAVAKQLGNRPATCRKYYIHPKVPESYLAGKLVPLMQSASQTLDYLEPHECAVLELLAR